MTESLTARFNRLATSRFKFSPTCREVLFRELIDWWLVLVIQMSVETLAAINSRECEPTMRCHNDNGGLKNKVPIWSVAKAMGFSHNINLARVVSKTAIQALCQPCQPFRVIERVELFGLIRRMLVDFKLFFGKLLSIFVSSGR